MEGGWTTPFVPKVVSSEPLEKKRTSWPPPVITTILPSGSMAIRRQPSITRLIRAHAQVAEREVGLAVGRVARQDEVAEPGLPGGDDSTLSVECDGFCRLAPSPYRLHAPGTKRRIQRAHREGPRRDRRQRERPGTARIRRVSRVDRGDRVRPGRQRDAPTGRRAIHQRHRRAEITAIDLELDRPRRRGSARHGGRDRGRERQRAGRQWLTGCSLSPPPSRSEPRPSR